MQRSARTCSLSLSRSFSRSLSSLGNHLSFLLSAGDCLRSTLPPTTSSVNLKLFILLLPVHPLSPWLIPKGFVAIMSLNRTRKTAAQNLCQPSSAALQYWPTRRAPALVACACSMAGSAMPSRTSVSTHACGSGEGLTSVHALGVHRPLRPLSSLVIT